MKLSIDKNRNIIRLSDRMADNIYSWEDEGKYRLEYLDEQAEEKRSKGGNSAVFKLVSTDDEDDIAIVKISRFPLSKKYRGINDRFEREIAALIKAKEKSYENIIQIKHDGVYLHSEKGLEKAIKYRFYIMEKADDDLGSFIPKADNQLTISQKVKLCKDILTGIAELHDMGVYHRDIKPDNIFLVNNDGGRVWKIGDLGLLSKRDEDLKFEKGKKIGPANWLSPEAMNKWLCEGTNRESLFDVKIDESSDTFQLAAVIWFVFNHNAPIGQLSRTDFLHKDYRIFNLVYGMLQHGKTRRNSIQICLNALKEIEDEYLSMGVEGSIKKNQNFRWHFRNFIQKLLITVQSRL